MDRVHNDGFLLALVAHGNRVAFAALARDNAEAAMKLKMIDSFLVRRLCFEYDFVPFLEALEKCNDAHFSFLAARFEELMPRLASP